MKRRNMKRPEDAIQQEVVRHLRERPIPGVFFCFIPNHKRKANYLKAMGMVSGAPDLILIREGRAFCLELKRPKGSKGIAQIACHAALRAAGVEPYTAYGLPDALDWLERNGFLRPEVKVEAA
jgi:hypothetical protein